MGGRARPLLNRNEDTTKLERRLRSAQPGENPEVLGCGKRGL